jgi:hypothetical protein
MPENAPLVALNLEEVGAFAVGAGEDEEAVPSRCGTGYFDGSGWKETGWWRRW